jgi:TonB family protein
MPPTKPDNAPRTTDAEALSAPAQTVANGDAEKPPATTAADAARTDGGTTVAAAAAPAGIAGKSEPKLPTPAKPSASAGQDASKDAAAAPPAEVTLFGVLDTDERIRQSGEQGERTLWTSAIVVTLLYTSLIAGHVLLGEPFSQSAAERERQRRGQDAPDSISVEIVPEPDAASKTRRWREGDQQQTPTPNEQPPQQQQMASIAQPEVPDADKPENEEAKDEPRPEGSPMLLDIESLVDAAAADLTRKIDRAFAKKPQKERRQQQAVVAGGGMKVRGTGASGRSDAFTRSVIAALMKTRPGPFALWGNVLVSFQVSETGQLRYVHLVHSSGNSALDQAAIEAIRKARFERPPPGLTPDERTYIIDYVFGIG